ncbi:hypothetical protein C0991_001918, partial [Blastosporella zonata]
PIREIYDRHLAYKTQISNTFLHDEKLDIVSWYNKKLLIALDTLGRNAFTPPYDRESYIASLFEEPIAEENLDSEYEDDLVKTWASGLCQLRLQEDNGRLGVLELNGQQIPAGTYP